MEYRKEREEYESSPLVQTVKEIVKRNPMSGWCGTVDDLKKQIYDITGKQISDSNAAIGRAIEKFEYRLYCDDIEHKVTRTSKERKHAFARRLPKQPYGYQSTIYDKQENDK